MVVKKEIPMKNHKKVMISFSPDGELFTIFNKKTSVLKVFRVPRESEDGEYEPLEELMANVQNDTDLLWEFSSKEVTTELSGCRAGKWSPCSQYLALSGYEKVSVLDMTIGMVVDHFSVF